MRPLKPQSPSGAAWLRPNATRRRRTGAGFGERRLRLGGMWRTLLLGLIASLAAVSAHAAEVGRWEVCRGSPGPVLTDCRPLEGVMDPQGRELWLRAPVGPL